MKKTLIINISNSIIHMEEDAYEVLTNYLLSIKSHFSGSADNLEIVSDIENRIAELLLEKLRLQNKQVINLQDVEEIILIMGTVSDFIDEEVRFEEDLHSSPKRLYRDQQKKILGGVISGLSHYLNLNVKWLRIFFLLCILLWGFGIMLYILMWIIVPPANSAVEQLKMRGEVPNLLGFKRNFEEKMHAFQTNSSQSILSQLGDALVRIIRFLLRSVGIVFRFMFKVAGLFIICFGVAFMLALIVGASGIVGFLDGNLFDYFPFNMVNPKYQDGLLLSSFLTLFIPVLVLVLFSIRYVFNKAVINKTLSFGLLIAWLLGVAFTTYFTAMLTSEFKEHAQVSKQQDLALHKEYVLELDRSMMFNQADSIRYGIDVQEMKGSVIIRDNDNSPFGLPRNTRISFQPNATNNALVMINYKSQGKSFKDALDNAKKIDYRYTVDANIIHFSPSVVLPEQTSWRNQEVDITLKLPVGTKLKIHNSMYPFLKNAYWNCDNGEHNDYLFWEITETGVDCTHKAHTD